MAEHDRIIFSLALPAERVPHFLLDTGVYQGTASAVPTESQQNAGLAAAAGGQG